MSNPVHAPIEDSINAHLGRRWLPGVFALVVALFCWSASNSLLDIKESIGTLNINVQQLLMEQARAQVYIQSLERRVDHLESYHRIDGKFQR